MLPANTARSDAPSAHTPQPRALQPALDSARNPDTPDKLDACQDPQTLTLQPNPPPRHCCDAAAHGARVVQVPRDKLQEELLPCSEGKGKQGAGQGTWLIKSLVSASSAPDGQLQETAAPCGKRGKSKRAAAGISGMHDPRASHTCNVSQHVQSVPRLSTQAGAVRRLSFPNSFPLSPAAHLRPFPCRALSLPPFPCRAPAPMSGAAEPCCAITSNTTATVVFCASVHSFHSVVPPDPTCGPATGAGGQAGEVGRGGTSSSCGGRGRQRARHALHRALTVPPGRHQRDAERALGRWRGQADFSLQPTSRALINSKGPPARKGLTGALCGREPPPPTCVSATEGDFFSSGDTGPSAPHTLTSLLHSTCVWVGSVHFVWLVPCLTLRGGGGGRSGGAGRYGEHGDALTAQHCNECRPVIVYFACWRAHGDAVYVRAPLLPQRNTHLQRGVGAQPQEALLPRRREGALERVSEHGVGEGVGLHHHAARQLHRVLHLRQPNLGRVCGWGGVSVGVCGGRQVCGGGWWY